MIADPADLVTGVPNRTADGQVAAAAVARYRTGKVKQLPDSAISKVAPITASTAVAPHQPPPRETSDGWRHSPTHPARGRDSTH